MLNRSMNTREGAIAPRADGTEALPAVLLESHTLGEPLGIAGVARLVGCSKWTVRHRFIPLGLPHWRTSTNGKYLFYRADVEAWWWGYRRKRG